MASTIECVICYEAIEGKNCVTTECGHQYHCTCLMKHVSANTFDCPMCRSCMGGADMKPVEDSDSEDDSDDDWDDEVEVRLFREFSGRNRNSWWDGNEGSTSLPSSSSISLDEENSSLRSFKWMFERVANDPTMSRMNFDDSNSNDLALMGVRNMFQRAEMELPIDLDGNSMAITPVSIRRGLVRRLEEEFEAVEVSEQEEEEEQELEAEAERIFNERKEEDFERIMSELIKEAKKEITYDDLLKSYLTSIPNAIAPVFDNFCSTENKVFRRMENKINRIESRMARYFN